MKVRYYCHIGQHTGYGKAALETACALMTVPGLELEIRALSPYDLLPAEIVERFPIKTDASMSPDPDVVLVHTLPLDCHRVIEIAQGGWTSSPKKIVYSTWEAATLPLCVQKAWSLFDQIWHPSYHVGALSAVVIPHAFDATTIPSRQRRERPPGPYRYYYIGAWNSRKNPAGVVRAYCTRFTKHDDVELVIHSPGTQRNAGAMAILSTGMSPDDAPRIRFSNTYVTDEEILDLHRMADCFVTASRGEAWNLPAFDAAVAARHVIATDSIGHTDYLMRTSYTPIEARVDLATVDVHVDPQGGVKLVGAQGLEAGCGWFDPSLHHLTKCMSDAYRDRLDHLSWHQDLGKLYHYDAVGERIRQALAKLFTQEEATP